MGDHLTLKQLLDQRAAVKKKLETMVKKGASADEFSKTEKYLKLLDKRIERSKRYEKTEGLSE